MGTGTGTGMGTGMGMVGGGGGGGGGGGQPLGGAAGGVTLMTDRTFLGKAPLLVRAHALVHGRSECILDDLVAVRHVRLVRVGRLCGAMPGHHELVAAHRRARGCPLHCLQDRVCPQDRGCPPHRTGFAKRAFGHPGT